jgi:hypothetical protein
MPHCHYLNQPIIAIGFEDEILQHFLLIQQNKSTAGIPAASGRAEGAGTNSCGHFQTAVK